jgi:uncharacterized protein (DUF58 family)
MIPKELLKKIRQIEIRTRHLVSDVFAGQYHSVFKGQGMEFEEVREYIPGDDIRSIDWNVTARMGHPFIKKYVEEREQTVMLLIDISGSQAVGSREQWKKDLCAEVAGVLALAATRNSDRVGLILFSDEVEHYLPPRKGTRHVLRVIRDALYCKPKRKGTSISAALTFLNHIAHRRTISFLISDFADQGFETDLRLTARRHDLISIVVDDRREREWPSAGVIEWKDVETGKTALVDTSSRAVRDEWSRRASQRKEKLFSFLRSAGIDAIPATAGEPYVQSFIRFFRERERRLAG